MTDTNHKAPENFSPVTATSSKNTWGMGLFCLFAGGVLLYLLFFHPTQKPKTPDPSNAITAPVMPVEAPTLTLSNHDIERLKTALHEINAPTPNKNPDEDSDKLYKMRLLAPVMVFSQDNSGQEIVSMNTATHNVLGGNHPTDSNSQFMANVSENQAPFSKATRIAHPSTTLTQGTMLWATLETRIVSTLPGMIRAVTSDDVYSDDDSQILIPKGSKLIGQYTSGISQGQYRVFVVWQRLIRPDHIDIALNSPGTDPLGTAGLNADSIDHHFFAQFGTATLLSLIGAGAANVGVNPNDAYNSQASYRQAIADSFSQTAQNTLQNTGTIAPTLTVNQGNSISVFLARDLDFYDVLQDSDAQS